MDAPYKRGFYCTDDSIRYPYKADTITHGLMAGVTITCTVVIVSTVGLGGSLLSHPLAPGPPWADPLVALQVSAGEAYLVYTERLYSRSEFNNYLAALYKVVGTFLFGGAVSQSLTDLAKYMIGRLRPNFLAVCDPDWTKVNCSIYMQLDNVCRGNSRNITESRCPRALLVVGGLGAALGLSPPGCKEMQPFSSGGGGGGLSGAGGWRLILQGLVAVVGWAGRGQGVSFCLTPSLSPSRLSFYSGHSSFGMYCMMFLAVSDAWGGSGVQWLELVGGKGGQGFFACLHPPAWLSPALGSCDRASGSGVGDAALGWLGMLTGLLPSLPAVHPGPAGGEVGPAPAPHDPVLPHRLRHLRGLHAGVGLQAPLERRAGGAAAGRARRRPHRTYPPRGSGPPASAFCPPPLAVPVAPGQLGWMESHRSRTGMSPMP